MGVVYRAVDRELGRAVAMKVLAGEAAGASALAARFLEEARAMARLEHPAIVPGHDIGTRPDGCVYFTMKLGEGRTFARVIAERGSGDPATVREWSSFRLLDAFLQICRAVRFAHERGVIHRDLKPQNVMVGPYGEVQVMDWGLARAIE